MTTPAGHGSTRAPATPGQLRRAATAAAFAALGGALVALGCSSSSPTVPNAGDGKERKKLNATITDPADGTKYRSGDPMEIKLDTQHLNQDHEISFEPGGPVHTTKPTSSPHPFKTTAPIVTKQKKYQLVLRIDAVEHGAKPSIVVDP